MEGALTVKLTVIVAVFPAESVRITEPLYAAPLPDRFAGLAVIFNEVPPAAVAVPIVGLTDSQPLAELAVAEKFNGLKLCNPMVLIVTFWKTAEPRAVAWGVSEVLLGSSESVPCKFMLTPIT
jgi:hypothetical protein